MNLTNYLWLFYSLIILLLILLLCYVGHEKKKNKINIEIDK